MNNIKNFFIKLKSKIYEDKKTKYFIFILLFALIIVVMLFSFGTKKAENKSSLTYENNYSDIMEEKLKNNLSLIDGVGEVSVVINVESNMETVLAYKTTINKTTNGTITETTPILVNGKTVVLKELYPKVVGVIIVCEGENNITVVNKILNATMSLLDIDKEKIEILKMK